MPPKSHGDRRPKQTGRAAAAAAAHAASRHRASTLAVGAGVEDAVRSALAGLDVGGGGGKPKVTAAAAADAYDAAVAAGFAHAQARGALTALVNSGAAVTPDALLDWLCLHTPPGDLPKRFAGAARAAAAAAGPVTVVARAKKGKPAPAPPPRDFPPSESEEESDDDGGAAAAAAAAEKAAADKAASKAYILRYMQEASSEEESDGWDDGYGGRGDRTSSTTTTTTTAQPSADDIEFSKYAVWADPREVERRRAERARAALPPAERRARVVEEWAVVRAEAARAKAAGDGARQKAVGPLLGALKREAAELGMTDAELEGREDEEEPTTPRSTTSSSSSDAGMALFGGGDGEDGDDGAGLQWDAPTTKAPTVDDLLAAAAPPPARRKPGAPPPPPARAEPKPPKALLQTLLAKWGLPPPRFEKRAPGGLREGRPEAGARYAACVDAAAPARAAGKPAPKPSSSKPPPLRYTLPEADDGWDTVQDAQNAAAARALFGLVGGKQMAADGASVLAQLGPPWTDLWLAWTTAGDAVATAGDSDGDGGDRDAFLAGLVGDASDSDADGDAPTTAAPAAPAPPSLTASLAAAVAARNAPAAAAARDAESDAMAAALAAFDASPEGATWAATRAALPAAAIRDDLLAALDAHDVVVVGGDTGCGKTTQVPQFLLDAAVRARAGGAVSIVCTQPRRIAALSVADRVAAERGDPGPGAPGGRVGYHVRLDAAFTAATRLLFCTTGILLRRLAGDPGLAAVTHVVVDEVHERSLDSDFLLALLRDLVPARRAAGHPLKVVLMSATLDAALFSTYFGGAPALTAHGRTFPVDRRFLEDAYTELGYRLAPDARAALRSGGRSAERRRLEKGAGKHAATVAAGWGDDEKDILAAPLNKWFDAADYDEACPHFVAANMARLDETVVDLDLVEDLVAHVDATAVDARGARDDGAILVFLPGFADIAALADRLAAHPGARDGGRVVVPLHSSVSPADQRRAFARPPAGARKIVLATNIAETSLTIDDVVYVIDAGKLKERRHDPARGMSLLCEDFVSRASARQRAGRAGRVRAGVAYTLLPRRRHDRQLRAFQAPEMVRVPLEELVLQIHALGVGPAAAFLARVVEPPPARAVQGAVAALVAVGALTPDETLTPLGRHLAALPVDARLGKLLVVGALLGVLAPALTVAATLADKSPFEGGFGAASDAVARVKAGLAAPGAPGLAAGQQSDHLVAVAAYDGWAAARRAGGAPAARAHARAGCLSHQALTALADMRSQFAGMLADAKLVPGGGRGKGWYDDAAAPWNAHAAKPAVIKAALTAALYPNVAVMADAAVATARPAWHDGSGEVVLHPSSCLAALPASAFTSPFLVYLEKMRTTRTFLRDATAVPPAALLLFGGALAVDHADGVVTVGDWVRVRAAAPTAVLVKKLRSAVDAYLEAAIAGKGQSGGGALVDALVALLLDSERGRE